MDPLFKAAVSYAIKSRQIDGSSDASEIRSRREDNAYLLADDKGQVLARLRIEDINHYQETQLIKAGTRLTIQEYERSLKVAQIYGRYDNKRLPSIELSSKYNGKVILRDWSKKVIFEFSDKFLSSNTFPEMGSRSQAIAWARSVGYPVPQEPNGCASAILIVFGLCIFIVPGLMILIWVAYNGQRYSREMDALVTRWIDAGRPEPGIKSNVEQMSTKPVSAIPRAEQLDELNRLLQGGLVSEDEYQSLRKKVLGI
jgi:hypothetical protein